MTNKPIALATPAQNVQARGRLTGEQIECGYGWRLVIEFDCPKPHFINRGYDVFVAAGFQCVELDAMPDLRHPSNQAPEHRADWQEFQGWVQARFNDGGRLWCFLSPHSDAYDAALRRYTKPIYNIQG